MSLLNKKGSFWDNAYFTSKVNSFFSTEADIPSARSHFQMRVPLISIMEDHVYAKTLNTITIKVRPNLLSYDQTNT